MSLRYCSVLFVLLFIMSGRLFGQGVSDGSIPSFEIISNEVVVLGKSDLKQREVYVFLLKQNPTKDSIARLFASIQSKYCSPFILRIIAYDDREMLDKLIRVEKFPIYIDFDHSKEGREAARRFYESAYPRAAGYFRARYLRYAAFEYFDYSPRSDLPEMERVDLKGIVGSPKAGSFPGSDCNGSPV